MTCCGYNGSTVRKRLKQFGKLTSALALLLFAAVSQAFVITDVRVEGLQRISAGTVFGSIPYNVGDNVDDEGLRRIIRAHFGQSTLMTSRWGETVTFCSSSLRNVRR